MEIEKIITNKVTLEIAGEIVNFTTTGEVKNENDAFDILKNNVVAIKVFKGELDIYKHSSCENGMLERFLTLPIKENATSLIIKAKEECGEQIEKISAVKEIFESYRKFVK